MKKQTILRKPAELKAPLLQFSVTNLGLFDSTVRGENMPSSDIDVLIDFQPEKETFQKNPSMRNKLIHDYMGINYLIVWDVAKNIIPTLISQIEEIISMGEDEVKD